MLKDILALMLAASLIFAPLCRWRLDYGFKLSDALPWLTIVVLIIQTGIFFRQAGIFARQGDLMSRQADISERAMTDYERPWLFPETVRALPRDEHPKPDNMWMISFGFRNVGKLPAINEECIVKIIDKDKAPPLPDYTGGVMVHVPTIVRSGDEFKTQGFGPADRRPDVRLVFGRLTYKELNGRRHKVGFAVDVAPVGVLTAYYPVEAYHYYD